MMDDYFPNIAMKYFSHHDTGGVILHLMQVGDILSALQVLALNLGDMKRAQMLCREEGNLEAYLTLLKLLLHPQDGRPPMYVEACCLLASEGMIIQPNHDVDLSSHTTIMSGLSPTQLGYCVHSMLIAVDNNRL
jgi:hypothetical protein